MEVSVGEKKAVLALHKMYRNDAVDSLRTVSAYTPFKKYLALCTEHGPVPSAFLVRSIRQIAHRVVGVVMDVECNTKSGKVVQTLELSDTIPAILLPVAVVDGTRYVFLVRNRRVSVGCNFTVEAFCGSEEEGGDGTYTWADEKLLVELGFNLNKVSTLSSTRYTIGNEGLAPFKVCTVNMNMSPETLKSLQRSSETEVVSGVSSFSVMPLEDVLSSACDAKACLAASVFLASIVD